MWCVYLSYKMAWTLCLCVLLYVIRFEVRAEMVMGKETEDFDFDGLPGATYEFKVDVAGGRDDCYYQKLNAHENMYVSYEVLRGGDGEIMAFLIDPDTQAIVQSIEKGPRGALTYASPVTKVYGICLDNTYSRMAAKLVYLLVISYESGTWEKYAKEIEEIDLTVGNFSNSVNQVFDSVQAALRHQADMRMHVLRDWYTINDKDTLIKRWSIFQCVVIVSASCFQVYFVRRLFRNVNVIPKKPRA